MDITTTIKLSSGYEMPALGLGMFRLNPGTESIDAVLNAMEAGYRHFDTASFYANEAELGIAIRRSGIAREEIFVTTKLWNADHGYAQALKAFDTSLKKLKIDYIDLYLIHWPVKGMREQSWKALETLTGSGLARSIGVSNYMVSHLKECLSRAELPVAANQFELNPYLQTRDLVRLCHENNIAIQAYSPLTRGKKFKDRKLVEIAGKYDKTPAQILIRWALQHGFSVLPKSANRVRIVENANVFDFSISDEDMAFMDTFDESFRVSWDPSDYQ